MARGRRHTPSTIDRLDPEIRKLIAELRIEKGWTIDEIRKQLIEIGQGHVSRSALGRHIRSIADVGAEMRETQVYAEALAKQAGDSSQSELLDLNAQLLQANMFRLMLASADGEGVQLSPKEAKEFSEALRNIALTRKTDLEFLAKAEQRGEEKAKRAAVEAVDRVAKRRIEGGLSKEAVDAFKREILKVG